MRHIHLLPELTSRKMLTKSTCSVICVKYTYYLS